MNDLKRFDEYEVSPVHETKDGLYCMAFPTEAEAIAAAASDGGRNFWTIYGRTEGIAEAISDFDTEATAFAILYRITGIEGVSGQRFYPAPEVRQGYLLPGSTDTIAAVLITAEDICSCVNDTDDEGDQTHGITIEQAAEYLRLHGCDVTDSLLGDFWTESITPIESMREFVAQHGHDLTPNELGAFTCPNCEEDVEPGKKCPGCLEWTAPTA